MDEPSRGIDIGAKAEVFRAMRALARGGLGILFVTSDLEEVMALSDRILVMANGRITGEFAARSGAEAASPSASAAATHRRKKDRGMSDDRNRLPPSTSVALASAAVLKLRTFIALIAVMVFFSIMAPNFLSAANVMIMSKHVALNAFLAIGMTFVIITGGIDLSVGSIVGLCGMVAGGLMLHGIDVARRLHRSIQHRRDRR